MRTTSKVVPVLVAAQDAKTALDRAGHLALRTVWEQPGWEVHSSKISLTEFNAEQIRSLLGSVIVEEAPRLTDDGAALARVTAERDTLVSALQDARASFLGLQPYFGGPVSAQMGGTIDRINAALARTESATPVEIKYVRTICDKVIPYTVAPAKCCDNEHRNMNGSRDNCGDPCL